MAKHKEKGRFLTTEELHFLVDHWEEKTEEELATLMDLPVERVIRTATLLRKLGVPLSRKHQGKKALYKRFVSEYFGLPLGEMPTQKDIERVKSQKTKQK